MNKTDFETQAIESNRIAVGLTQKNKYSSIENAIKYLDKAIKMNPYYDSAFANRASAYVHKRNYRLAIDDCNQAIRLNPYNSKAFIIRANCNCKLGNYKQARYDYGQACELGALSFKNLMKILKRKGINRFYPN